MDEKDKKTAAGGAADGADAGKKAKKAPNPKVMLIAIIAGAIVLNVILSLVMIQVTKPKDTTEKEATEKVDSAKVKAEKGGAAGSAEVGGVTSAVEAIVNIAGTNGERFLKVVIKFGFDDKRYPKMEEEMKKLNPKIKDMLLEILAPMTLTELNEPETRGKLRKDILRAVNNGLPAELCQMNDVYIDQFIIQ